MCLLSVDITHLQEADLNKGSLLACWCACETLPRLIVLIRSCFFSRQALLLIEQGRHPSLEEHYDCLDINFSSTSSLSLSGSFFVKEQETIWFYRYRSIRRQHAHQHHMLFCVCVLNDRLIRSTSRGLFNPEVRLRGYGVISLDGSLFTISI